MSARIKVLLLHNILSPHIEPVLRELGEKVDLDVLYCSEKESNRSWKVQPQGYTYKILSSWKLEFQGKDLFTLFVNPEIFSELSTRQPDLVILAGWDLPSYWLAALYCRMKKIPYLVWSGSTIFEDSWRRSLTHGLVRAIVKGAAGFIAYGLRARDYLVLHGANALRITVAYNGFNYTYYSQATHKSGLHKKLRNQLNLQNKTVLLFYGQLVQRKNPEILMHAFAAVKSKYPQLALVLVGDGPEKQKLEKLRSDLGLKDSYILPNPGDEHIREYYAMSDIFVLPSQEEVWGLVVNQAMAAGLPVVCSSAVGCVPDLIIPGETGYVFESNNQSDLEAKIEHLLQNDQQRKDIGTQAQSHVRLASAEKVAERVFKAIQQVFNLRGVGDEWVKYCQLPVIEDDCKLVVAEPPYVPFNISRIYYLYESKPDFPRGFHAHKQTTQVLFCLQGSVQILLDNGKERTTVELKDPSKGVVLSPLLWHEMHNLQKETILLVLASEPYDPNDYIRSYTEFLSMTQ